MTPIEGTLAEINKAIVNQVCAEHGERVVAVWDSKASVAMVKCARGEYPPRLKAVPSQTDVVQREPNIPVFASLSNLPKRDLGDNHEITIQERRLIIEYAQKYGLDPYRGHVMLMYGQPYIGLDGYIWSARARGIHCSVGSRPLSAAEKELYQIGAGDLAWVAEGERLDTGEKALGVGIVRAEELTEHSAKNPDRLRYPVVAAHPQLLAQKRAEWQWYRRMCPIGEEVKVAQVAQIVATVEVSSDDARRLAGLNEAQSGQHEREEGHG